MGKNKRKTLELKKESLRKLSGAELRVVAGAMIEDGGSGCSLGTTWTWPCTYACG